MKYPIGTKLKRVGTGQIVEVLGYRADKGYYLKWPQHQLRNYWSEGGMDSKMTVVFTPKINQFPDELFEA